MLHIEHKKIERKRKNDGYNSSVYKGLERKRNEKEEENFEVTAYGSRTVYIYEEISENIGFIRD